MFEFSTSPSSPRMANGIYFTHQLQLITVLYGEKFLSHLWALKEFCGARHAHWDRMFCHLPCGAAVLEFSTFSKTHLVIAYTDHGQDNQVIYMGSSEKRGPSHHFFFLANTQKHKNDTLVESCPVWHMYTLRNISINTNRFMSSNSRHLVIVKLFRMLPPAFGNVFWVIVVYICQSCGNTPERLASWIRGTLDLSFPTSSLSFSPVSGESCTLNFYGISYWFHMRSSMQTLCFHSWLVSLNLRVSGSIHMLTNDRISLLLWLCSIPLHACTPFSLSVHHFIDT